VFEEYPTEEQLSDVRFLWEKGLKVKDIHKEMFHVYGENHLSSTAVEKFSQG
jgi:predicted regulator of amino acid metabolism with ACT domain